MTYRIMDFSNNEAKNGAMAIFYNSLAELVQFIGVS